VTALPHGPIRKGVARGPWYHTLQDGRVQCDLCPRACKMKSGQRGFCYVRGAEDDSVVLHTYGRASGFCVDPIEKKPLNHFYPGTSVLSFGTAGCNLGCRFCQNWDISKARQDDRLQDLAAPEDIVAAAKREGCRSIAYTYNDPVIFAEFAIDCAAAAREQGVANVAVTAGYISEQARPDFFRYMDATNVDLKAFTEEFYAKQCYAGLHPVLETLVWLKEETDVWLEVTTLLIPGLNDSDQELEQQCSWFAAHLGQDVPLHFTAFHPDFKLTDRGNTPAATLSRARKHAVDAGLRYVYTGNVVDRDGQSTWCPECSELLIERDRYDLGRWNVRAMGEEQIAHCRTCGATVPGRFEEQPGSWGSKRRRLTIVEAA